MRDRGAAAWQGVCGALAGGAVLGWWLPAALLDWQPGLALAQPWRLVTAAWVHWSVGHLAANLAGVLVVAALGMVARLPARAAAALVLAWPLTHAGLWVQPALAHYGGASGVLHAAVGVAACWLVAGVGPQPAEEAGTDATSMTAAAPRQRRAIGTAIAAGLFIKVLLEAPWAGPTVSVRGWDIAVAPVAHASGALAGAVLSLLMLWLPGGRAGFSLHRGPPRLR